jgi:acyl-CoA thioester hydrolase
MYSVDLQVRISDINYGGHLDFAKLIAMAGDARAQFFHAKNIKDINENGIGIITRSVQTNYLAQCFFNDILEFNISTEVVKKTRLILSFDVKNKGTKDPVAKILIELIFINYNNGKPVKIPEEYIIALI